VQLPAALKAGGYEVADFGAHELIGGDDSPDFVVPPAKAVAIGARLLTSIACTD
jgi:ribose 5-phosphate isomerase B